MKILKTIILHFSGSLVETEAALFFGIFLFSRHQLQTLKKSSVIYLLVLSNSHLVILVYLQIRPLPLLFPNVILCGIEGWLRVS